MACWCCWLGLGYACARADEPAIAGYADFTALSQRLQKLDVSELVKVESLAKTLAGREVWLATIARAGAAEKPAILIVGNAEGAHLVGSELAVRLAELLAAAEPNTPAAALLDRFSFYVIPRPNPDASEAFFQKPYAERSGNTRSTDDDRDGETDEDPTQDLDGDGWITQLRVDDASGSLAEHPGDGRVLIEVDPRKNERGKYRLYSEGIDDDHDEAFNEDGPGGVSLNRNFTFRYPYFEAGAGPNQVSEPESRAVADFAFAHPNIALVLTFTPEDNLFEPWKPGDDGARIKTSVLTEDAGYLNYVAEQYRELHGGKDAPPPSKGAGSLSEWAYFHYGRWSLGARAWWIPKVPPKPEAPPAEGQKPAEGEKPVEGAKPAEAAPAKPKVDEKRGADDINALEWLAQQGIEGFVPWKAIAHPDFPDHKVELGGFKPFLRLNPPSAELDPLAARHLSFLVRLGELLPRLKIARTKVDALGEGVFRLTATVENQGFLPTVSAMGKASGQPHPLQIEVVLPAGAKLLSGHPRIQLAPLAGSGGQAETTWLLLAPQAGERNVDIKVWSPSVGLATERVELK